MRRALIVAILSAPVSAFAASSLRVADVLPSDEKALGADAVHVAFPEGEVSAEAPDVVDDPAGGTEVISHLPSRMPEKGIDQDAARWARRAHAVLSAAGLGANAAWQRIFAGVRSSLSRSTVTWPRQGMDFRSCGEKTLAFVIRGQSVIHLCARAAHGGRGDKMLAQILIHEAAHVGGYHDECDATRVEVNAMKLSGEGLAFRNGYMDRCRLD